MEAKTFPYHSIWLQTFVWPEGVDLIVVSLAVDGMLGDSVVVSGIDVTDVVVLLVRFMELELK